MENIIKSLKAQFKQPNNGVTQLMIIHIIAFTALLLGNFVFTLLFPTHTIPLYQYLALAPQWETFIEKPWTLFTYTFVNLEITSCLWHVIGIYTIGKIVTRFLGNTRFIFIYLLGSWAGGLSFLAFCHYFPKLDFYFTYNHFLMGGLSSFYALVAATATFSPNYPLHLFLFGSIRLKYIMGFLLLFILFPLLNQPYTITYIAPLSASFFGYLYVKLLGQDIDIGKPLFAILGAIRKVKKMDQKFKISVHPNKSPKKKVKKDEISAILKKLSLKGYEQLTEKERKTLFNNP